MVDLLELAKKGEGFLISLRAGVGKPVYASGFCLTECGKTVCATRSTNGKTGVVELTPRGTGLHYRSFYDEGATTWEGDFVAQQGAAATVTQPVQPPAAATPAPRAQEVSQWIRTQSGTAIDVLTMKRQGSKAEIDLREGFGKPVYSSGTCTVSGETVNCGARTTSGKTVQIVLTQRGSSMHYRSVYDGGKATWEGDFTRFEPVR